MALDGLADVVAALGPGLAMLDRTIAASGLSLPALTALGKQLSTNVSVAAPTDAIAQSADWSSAADWNGPVRAGKANASAGAISATGALRGGPIPQFTAAREHKRLATNAENRRPMSAVMPPDMVQSTISVPRPETVPTETTATPTGPAAIARSTFEAGSRTVSEPEPGHHTVNVVGVGPDLPQPGRRPPVRRAATPPPASTTEASSSVPSLSKQVEPAQETAIAPSRRPYSAARRPIASATSRKLAGQQSWGEMSSGDNLGEAGQTRAVAEYDASTPGTEWTAPSRPAARSAAIPSEGALARDEVDKPMAQTADQELDAEDRQSTESDAQESMQGRVMLDAAQITRWVIEQLEHRASRPGAMITGIDPRMTPTYPGAPTGA